MNTNEKLKRVLSLTLAVLLVLASAACLAGCGKEGTAENEKEEAPAPSVEIPSFELESLPVIDESLALVPLAEGLAAALTGTDKDTARQYIEYTNTHPAYLSLIEGERDLIFATYPSQEEQEYAANLGVELEIIPVVSEGFVFFNNEKNPVKGLTSDQIKEIYTGKITNWSQVGGDNVELTPYQRRVNSGSQSGMLALVMKDLEIMEAPTKNVIAEMGEIIDAVASYRNGEDALGYSYYYFVKDMYGDNGIKLLEVDGVEPSPETISDGSYPFITAYYAVFNKNEPEDSDVRKIVDFLLSDEGQALAEQEGYVRVNS